MTHSIRAVEQKQALHRMLASNSRPPKALADIVGVAYSTLMSWGDEHQDAHIPSARIPALLASSDSPALLEYWASLMGRLTVDLPRRSDVINVCQLAAVAESFAKLLRAHADAVADGKWTAAEFAELQPIASQLIANTAAHLQYVAGQVER